VRQQDVGVVRIDARVFGRLAPQERGIRRHELIERRRAEAQHAQRGVPAPPSPTHPLHGRCARARIAGEHHRIDPADVDAELERVGGGDDRGVARAQGSLDFPPSIRQVAAAIAPHRPRRRGLARGTVGPRVVLHVAGEQLDRLARAAEHQRGHGLLAQYRGHGTRDLEVVAAHPRRLVDDLGIEHEGGSRSHGRAAGFEQHRRRTRRTTRQPHEELIGVGDRG
jgi:hypothetical protein